MVQKILNLTQHVATPEQIGSGVFEPSEEDKNEIRKLLTFDEKPTCVELHLASLELSKIATKYFSMSYAEDIEHRGKAMIGGAPYFMRSLENALIDVDVWPVYAFSKRESVDQPQPDGSVRKVQVFRHAGFVEV